MGNDYRRLDFELPRAEHAIDAADSASLRIVGTTIRKAKTAREKRGRFSVPFQPFPRATGQFLSSSLEWLACDILAESDIRLSDLLAWRYTA